MTELNPIVRAFELAKSGECADVVDLERKLRREGYAGVSAHLGAPTLRKQLSMLVKDSRCLVPAGASDHAF